jgi:hypothetical protein
MALVFCGTKSKSLEMSYLIILNQFRISMAHEHEDQEIALMRLESFYGFQEIASCPETYEMMVQGSQQELQDNVIAALEAEAAIAYADARVCEWRVLEKCNEAAFAGAVGGIVAKYLQPKLDIQTVYAEPLKALKSLETHFQKVEHLKKQNSKEA